MAQPDSNPAHTEQLNQAIDLFKAGRRAEARTLLADLTRQAPEIELGWMWLAAVTDETDEKVTALQRVLSLNPANSKARAALEQLTGEALPPLPARARAGDAARTPLEPAMSSESSSEQPLPAKNNLITVVLVIVVILAVFGVGAAVLNSPRVQGLLRPSATATVTPYPTLTPTLRISLTPSITPGGPTLTPYVQPSLPPSFTPVPTVTSEPSFTPAPTLTDVPSATVITRPTITPFLSATPTEIPTLIPIPTLPEGSTGSASTVVATVDPITETPGSPPAITKTATATSTITETAASTLTETNAP